MREQMRVVRDSVAVSEQIAVLLSKYDVDDAAALVDGTGAAELPPAMRDAYRTLIGNLRGYKAYLPMSVMFGVRGDGSGAGSASSATSLAHSLVDGRDPARGADSPRAADPPARAHRNNASSTNTYSNNSSRGSSSRSASASWSSHQSSLMPPSPRPLARQSSFPFDRQCSLLVDQQSSLLLDAPQNKVVTLMLQNRLDFLPAAAQQPEEVPTWLSVQVEEFVAEVKHESGCVDHVSSDRFFASFGAARRCDGHCVAALRCAARSAQSHGEHAQPGGAADADAPPAEPSQAEGTADPAGLLAALRRSSACCSGHA
eukprot:gene12164-24774_t